MPLYNWSKKWWIPPRKRKMSVNQHRIDYTKGITELNKHRGYFSNKVGSTGCYWQAVFTNGQATERKSGACHRGLGFLNKWHVSRANEVDNGPVGLLFTSAFITRKESLKAATRWFKWIMSDDSPWHLAAKGGTLHLDSKDRPLFMELITFSDNKCPAQIFMNLMHMSRMPYEQPGFIEYWAWLLDNVKGMTKERALVYSTNFHMDRLSDGTLFLTHKAETCHYPLDPYRQANIKALEDKTPCSNRQGFDKSHYRYDGNMVSYVVSMWKVPGNTPLRAFDYKQLRLCLTDKNAFKTCAFPSFTKKFIDAQNTNNTRALDPTLVYKNHLDVMYGKEYRCGKASK